MKKKLNITALIAAALLVWALPICADGVEIADITVIDADIFKNPAIRLFVGPAYSTYEDPTYPGDFDDSMLSMSIELGTTKRLLFRKESLSIFFNKPQTDSVSEAEKKIELVEYNALFFTYQLGKGVPKPDDANLQNATKYIDNHIMFGFNSMEGAGYKAIDLELLNGGGLIWSNLDITYYQASLEPPLPQAQAAAVTTPYDGDFRFGEKYTSEINAFKVANMISLNLGVDRTVIYPRYLFWKWAGSAIIKGAADGLLNIFTRTVGKASPAAYPIVYFILNSALDFGYTELQKSKMNWPFESAEPYINDGFHVGLKFEF